MLRIYKSITYEALSDVASVKQGKIKIAMILLTKAFKYKAGPIRELYACSCFFLSLGITLPVRVHECPNVLGRVQTQARNCRESRGGVLTKKAGAAACYWLLLND